MSNTPLRILPVLIIVAMLTFSVRVADMVMGVSSLNGSAMAEKEHTQETLDTALAQKEPQAGDDGTPAKTIDEQIAEKKSQTENPQGEKSMSIDAEESESLKVTDVADIEPPDIDWRDASDQQVDYSNVRMEIFDDLSDRRKIMDRREKEMMTREALIRAAEQEMDRKFQELSNLRKEIIDLLEQQSEEEKARIASLVKIYEGMKPKDAARIFDTLDLDVLIAVMSEMSERKLSPVLAAMNPERARTITIMLAEQKQLPDLPLGQ